MDMSNYRELFLSETREHINNLNKLVVTLEEEPDNRGVIDALFREAHSVKGMAATMGYDQTAKLAHHLEDMLDNFRTTGEVPTPAVDYLLKGIDLLENLLDDLQGDQPERDTTFFIAKSLEEEIALPADSVAPEDDDSLAGAAADAKGSFTENLADDQETAPQPDTFQVVIELAADTPAAAARGILILRELEKAGELKSSTPDMDTLSKGGDCQQIKAWLCTSLNKDHIEEALLLISGVTKVEFIDDRRQDDHRQHDEAVSTIRVRTDLLDQFVNLAGELITRRHMLKTASNRRSWQDLNQALGQAGRLIDDLHHHVLQARLMPLENITGRLPRIVRDMSRKSDKKVALRLTGTDVGIDRTILEELTDPLVHLVRNAVDHGIEQKGVVTVSARREKDLVLVEVTDDGKGMCPDHLRQKAIARELITRPQAENMSDHDALMLVCQPGFSTADEVTETSGRGVGMDVVKEAINKLGGTLDIISSFGEGTRFQMRLPLSVTRVQRTLDLPSSEIRTSGSQRVFFLDEEEINLYTLAEALGQPNVPAKETAWIIMTEVQGRRIGLQVDCFLGQRDAFVKQAGFPMSVLPGLSGATIEGDGQVVFILDPQALLEDRQLFTSEKQGGADALS
jgi:two-component system chemotaxis sensor kinase CheA